MKGTDQHLKNLDWENLSNPDFIKSSIREIDESFQHSRNQEEICKRRHTAEEMAVIAQYNAKNLFNRLIDLDDSNIDIFKLLCLYFSRDESFNDLANELGVENPSIHKGIALCGSIGVGKTFLLKAFSRNPYKSYKVINSKYIANQYEAGGWSNIGLYTMYNFMGYKDDSLERRANLMEDVLPNLYSSCVGVCVDDFGNEDKKCYMGNRTNVIGDLVEKYYDEKKLGDIFHITTNLNIQEIEEFYGKRVKSRLAQRLNFILWLGEDRRL